MRNIHGVLYTWADRKPIEDLLKHWGGTPVEHKPIIYVSGPSEHFLRMRNGKLSVKQAQPISDANRSIPTGGELEPQILTSRVHEEALPLPIPANRIHKEMYVQTPGTSRKLIYNVESLIENLANNPNYNLIRTDGNVTYRIGARGTGTKLDSPRGTITIGERVKVDIADLAFFGKPGKLIRVRSTNAEDAVAIANAFELPKGLTTTGSYTKVFNTYAPR